MILHRFKLEAPTLDIAFERAKTIARDWMMDQPRNWVEDHTNYKMEFDLVHAGSAANIALFDTGKRELVIMTFWFEVRRPQDPNLKTGL